MTAVRGEARSALAGAAMPAVQGGMCCRHTCFWLKQQVQPPAFCSHLLGPRLNMAELMRPSSGTEAVAATTATCRTQAGRAAAQQHRSTMGRHELAVWHAAGCGIQYPRPTTSACHSRAVSTQRLTWAP